MSKNTRDEILDQCFKAVSKKGFVALRTDNEIKNLNITKGAFYHYFSSKNQLGISLIEERIKPYYENLWGSFINNPENIRENYVELLKKECRRVELNGVYDIMCTMSVEINQYDDILKESYANFVNEFLGQLQSAIRQAKGQGKIVQSGDSKSQALHLLNGTMSCFLLAAVKESTEMFSSSTKTCIKNLEASFFTERGEALPFA